MDYLHDLLTTVWALRWLLTIVFAGAAFAYMATKVTDLREQRDHARAQARSLIFENHELRAQLRRRGRAPIISGRVIQ